MKNNNCKPKYLLLDPCKHWYHIFYAVCRLIFEICCTRIIKQDIFSGKH